MSAPLTSEDRRYLIVALGSERIGTKIADIIDRIEGAGGSWTDVIFDAASEVTIASGAVALTQGAHTVDTESDAATDDLTDITGLTAEEVFVLRPANAARTVVIKHGIGANKIACPGGQDITLTAGTDHVIGYHNGTQAVIVGDGSLIREASELTIASGAIAVCRPHHTVDTEGDAATDDLTDVTGLGEGQRVVIKPVNGSRNVIVKHAVGANKIICPGAVDIPLVSVNDYVELIGTGTQAVVIGGSTLAKAYSLSAEITGSGSSQDTAHGLGVVPGLVFAIPSDLTGGACTVAYGAHDATNAKVTVTSGEKYRVLAFR